LIFNQVVSALRKYLQVSFEKYFFLPGGYLKGVRFSHSNILKNVRMMIIFKVRPAFSTMGSKNTVGQANRGTVKRLYEEDTA
jgi:hypothetical protein